MERRVQLGGREVRLRYTVNAMCAVEERAGSALEHLTDRQFTATRLLLWGGMLEADCLIHGDACLPNILQQAGHFSAFIDLAMAGAGDRHIDLYWALWSLGYNLKTEAYGDLFLDLYGREKVSEEKLKVVAAFELFG